jgi:predicted transglutaminase-like cysteine proteinase
MIITIAVIALLGTFMAVVSRSVAPALVAAALVAVIAAFNHVADGLASAEMRLPSPVDYIDIMARLKQHEPVPDEPVGISPDSIQEIAGGFDAIRTALDDGTQASLSGSVPQLNRRTLNDKSARFLSFTSPLSMVLLEVKNPGPGGRGPLYEKDNEGSPVMFGWLSSDENLRCRPANDFLNEIATETEPSLDVLVQAWHAVARHIGYKHDAVTAQKSESWHSPANTAERGFGDCDDFAILLANLLRARGITAYLVIGETNGSGHAWCAVHFGGRWFAIEPQQDPGEQLSGLDAIPLVDASYKPWLLVDRHASFLPDLSSNNVYDPARARKIDAVQLFGPR